MQRRILKSVKALWFVLVIVVAGNAGGGMAATAAPPAQKDAEAFIQSVADEVFATLRNAELTSLQKKTAVRTMMNRTVAVDYIAKLSLGRFGRPRGGLTAEERAAFDTQLAEYNALFPDYLFEKFYDLIITKFDNASVQLTGSTPVKATDTIVHTKILRPAAEPVLADWRVRADRGGKLKVIDVKAEGISLIITQRDDFAAVIGTGGLDRLLEHMRTQIAARQVAASAGNKPHS